ncbi:hypothetical protein AQUCO_02300059v1 [Aquilegia coerulea]|uniref:DUF679 domain-containing protein n=1 Tax=Aquilegia coerulea TaxID=218851 RepID=A0A2G5DBV9_AQUCA|nr:hypothetical protein AQUCO_02300059v1 [Aquilegia coerulea]
MSLRGRPVSTTSTTTLETSSAPISDSKEFQIQNTTTASPSLPQRCINQTLTSTANLANLLPTGTLLALQLLVPTFTNNGSCDSATHFMTQVLLLLLASSCFLASFTDSFKSPDGKVYYGLATFKGMWLFSYPMTESSLPDLSKYRLRIIDGIHAVLSVLTFVAVALRDANVLKCFYPQPEHETQEILNIAPMGIGFMCGLLFVVFPTTRHGIGYPVSSKN